MTLIIIQPLPLLLKVEWGANTAFACKLMSSVTFCINAQKGKWSDRGSNQRPSVSQSSTTPMNYVKLTFLYPFNSTLLHFFPWQMWYICLLFVIKFLLQCVKNACMYPGLFTIIWRLLWEWIFFLIESRNLL